MTDDLKATTWKELAGDYSIAYNGLVDGLTDARVALSEGREAYAMFILGQMVGWATQERMRLSDEFRAIREAEGDE